MALIGINLINNGTTTIDSSNAGSAGDTIQLNLVSNGTVIVDGVDVNISNLVGTGALSSTTIEAINGANVTINASLANIGAGSTYTYAIGANSSITVDAGLLTVGLLNGVTVDFANANGSGLFAYNPGGINLNLSTPPNVVNVQAGDKIEVVGSNVVSQSGNTITFFGGLLNAVPLGSYTIPAGVTYSYDANTDTLTFTSCFLRGTLIRTPEGDIPVEDLRVGDLVVTHKGVAEIKWVGRRRLDPKAIDKPRDTLPIRIRIGAFAENIPSRDLYVSPDHCMFLEESLIPAKFLVNGTTVTQEATLAPFEYFHIELEQHSIILAEGAPTETYLDLGGRLSFLEPGVLRFGAMSGAATRSWNDWCYPPVYAGKVLEQVRAILERRAEELGYIIQDAQAS
ncbi:type I secretion protein [Rhizobium dioscoreae]|uniref:Hint domain-containing protein n=1 Tax=Rhizobium TaxID=379 RepID=UPI000DDC89E5|nr:MULTISPECIES: Hint domain-containing protein [Rhizobium]MCZ3379863.1 Hint domain-containing protein [Rhizobium sp. AG207R]TWB14834.1 Hint domain-containing protein [Rhizobium sp. ERR1071]GES46735.1 type I secretion protein [Rhizobium dioscoreae]